MNATKDAMSLNSRTSFLPPGQRGPIEYAALGFPDGNDMGEPAGRTHPHGFVVRHPLAREIERVAKAGSAD